MGLDIVEVMMGVEEEFGIEIPDDHLAAMKTPGHLHAYLVHRIRAARHSTGGCPNQYVFHTVRRGLMATLPLGRRDVRLDTELESLFPRAGRREGWQRLATRLCWVDPNLAFPARYILGAWLSIFAVAGHGCLSALGREQAVMALAAAAAFASVLCIGVTDLLRARATMFPQKLETVRDLVLSGVAASYATEPGNGQWPTERDIWHRMVRVVAAQAGIDELAVTPDAEWRRDLGID